MSEPLRSSRFTVRLIETVRALERALSQRKRAEVEGVERSFVYRDGVAVPGNERIYLATDEFSSQD